MIQFTVYQWCLRSTEQHKNFVWLWKINYKLTTVNYPFLVDINGDDDKNYYTRLVYTDSKNNKIEINTSEAQKTTTGHWIKVSCGGMSSSWMHLSARGVWTRKEQEKRGND